MAVLKLNHLGCRKCRPEWLKQLKSRFAEHLNHLCEECRERFRVNPLRILDCKKERCRGILYGELAASERLCASCREHADQVQASLQALGLYPDWDNRLVRGLDYYTGTVFEVIHTGLGEKAQSAIAAGGRYDDLVQEMGGTATPAVGFAVGLDRVRMVQEEQALAAGSDGGLKVFVATVAPEQVPHGLELAEGLRAEGVSSVANLEDRPLKRQMEQASRLVPNGLVLILGEEEVRTRQVTVKEMSTGQQRKVPRDELLAAFFRDAS